MVTRLGTGSGALARAESAVLAKRLDAELVVVEDSSHDPSSLIDALAARDVDAVVVRADLDWTSPDVALAAVPKRGDARDALTGTVALAGLPRGSRILVHTALRRAQLLGRAPELTPVADGDVAASLTALATLSEPADAAEVFELDDWPTTPGQGVVVILTRPGDEAAVAKLEHPPSRLTVLAELGVLQRVEVSVATTLAAHAELDDGLLFLSARVYRPDGSGHVTSSHALYPEDSKDPVGELADRVVGELLGQGAGGFAGEPS